MGKKKVAQQTSEELLKEKAEVDSALERSAAGTAKKSKRIEQGRVYINSSYNN
ncbi:30S ribosomal protein S11, partial [Candidatus Parcubacteria bacterium]